MLCEGECPTCVPRNVLRCQRFEPGFPGRLVEVNPAAPDSKSVRKRTVGRTAYSRAGPFTGKSRLKASRPQSVTGKDWPACTVDGMPPQTNSYNAWPAHPTADKFDST